MLTVDGAAVLGRDVLRVDENAAAVEAAARDGDGHEGERRVVRPAVADEQQEQRLRRQRHRLSNEKQEAVQRLWVRRPPITLFGEQRLKNMTPCGE